MSPEDQAAHDDRLAAAASLFPQDALAEIRAALGPDGLAALAKAFPTPEERAATSRVCELGEDEEALQAAVALGLLVRYDAERPDGQPRWTVALPGIHRGDGFTPAEAGAQLRARLDATERDAREWKDTCQRLAAAHLASEARAQRAESALAALRAEVGQDLPPWRGWDNDEEPQP